MIYLKILIRFIVSFLLLKIIFKLIDIRKVKNLSIIDFVYLILFSQLLIMSIYNYNVSYYIFLIPILFFIILLMIKLKIYNFIEDEVIVIINNGKVNFKEMLKHNYSIKMLISELKKQKIKSIKKIDYALLDNNKLLIYCNDNNYNNYPIPVIIDGKIKEKTLNTINKNKKWVNKMLSIKNTSIDKIFYAFYLDNKLYIIKNKL